MDADAFGRVDEFALGVDHFHLADGFGNVYELDLGVAEGDHFAEAALGDEIDAGDAEACAEDAVKGRRRTAALDVSENGGADFFFRAGRDGVTDNGADHSGARKGSVSLDVLGDDLIGNLDAFGDAEDSELLAEDVALIDEAADVIGSNGISGRRMT